MVVFDEVITFDLGGFLFDWPEETVKVFNFRETIVDKFIDALFEASSDAAAKRQSRRSLLQKAIWSTSSRSARSTN